MENETAPVLQIYAVGPTTVVGFGGADVLDHVNLAICRDEVVQLIEEHEAKVIAFDMTGVKLMPSGLLGVLASLRKCDVEVHVYNPSPDVRDVFEVTHLDRLISLHEIEVTNVPVESDTQ